MEMDEINRLIVPEKLSADLQQPHPPPTCLPGSLPPPSPLPRSVAKSIKNPTVENRWKCLTEGVGWVRGVGGWRKLFNLPPGAGRNPQHPQSILKASSKHPQSILKASSKHPQSILVILRTRLCRSSPLVNPQRTGKNPQDSESI